MTYKQYKPIVETVFSNYNRLVNLEQDDYLERLLSVMKSKKLISFDRGESDFGDFAVRAYLHNLKNKIQEWENILAAVIATRNIADGFDHNNLEEQDL